MKDSKMLAALLEKVEDILRGAGERDRKLGAVAEALKNGVPHYDWVGFYISNPEETELTLGPFVGEPTEHVKIPFGRGICGRAAEKRETLVIRDVAEETNYLSCSPMVRSEIVIPIFSGDKIVAELDIDSHTPAVFSSEDETFLSRVCELVAPVFE